MFFGGHGCEPHLSSWYLVLKAATVCLRGALGNQTEPAKFEDECGSLITGLIKYLVAGVTPPRINAITQLSGFGFYACFLTCTKERIILPMA